MVLLSSARSRVPRLGTSREALKADGPQVIVTDSLKLAAMKASKIEAWQDMLLLFAFAGPYHRNS